MSLLGLLLVAMQGELYQNKAILVSALQVQSPVYPQLQVLEAPRQ